jgi:hypothetical protein
LQIPWFYVEKFQKIHTNLLELIKKFKRVSGYKINVPKSITLLYTNSQIHEIEIKKDIPFIVATKAK